jgi:hypothetical protein
MTIKKQFAQAGAGLDDCMDQLLEVLAQLLSEQQEPAGDGVANRGEVETPADLPSGDERAIHVVVNNPKK